LAHTHTWWTTKVLLLLLFQICMLMPQLFKLLPSKAHAT